ncbi:zinc finger protein ZPR1 [Condylostylus longicornis]|uniref:zinc finger protein ZPR1 n=1 Tax=Condylostylus longicornis TaxID=2530218 RepID=UPI00244DC80D|nr:zinc finger protein ZPR1 [Condylostylus longicornis]
MEAELKKPLFRDLNPEDEEQETTTIESVCMNCFKNGKTRLLLTKIPFYKEIVLMSFNCDECGYENNEIQTASEISPKGCKIVLNVNNAADLNRKVVKSDYSAVKVPEVNLEIPAKSQKGEVTTVEGIIQRTITGLSQDQEARRKEHPDTAKSIDDYIEKLRHILNIELFGGFTLILEDVSGNSFIENPNAPHVDHNCKTTEFIRNEDENKIVGIYEESVSKEENIASEKENILQPIPEDSWPLKELEGEVLQFPTLCYKCRSPCETNMKMTSIPHFKEVVIMATTCEVCGYRTNEIKSGGGILDKGTRFEVNIKDKEDLSRDILKSETCSMSLLEFDCHVGPAALGGRFTTIEGILCGMKEQLQGNTIPFRDSADEETKEKLNQFIKNIDRVINLDIPATLILDDPAGNSYIQSLADDKPDEKLKIHHYERSFEQNEELGLNDMKTEDY